MKKWEYKIIDSIDAPGDVGRFFKKKDRNAIEAYLNQLGELGWEIINVDFRELEDRSSFCGVARREKQGGAEQPATAPESKPEGKEKSKSESEGRSQ